MNIKYVGEDYRNSCDKRHGKFDAILPHWLGEIEWEKLFSAPNFTRLDPVPAYNGLFISQAFVTQGGHVNYVKDDYYGAYKKFGPE